MKASIILPVYNVRSLIDATIQSVFQQTYTDWELIIVDDHSTDGTYEHIQKKFGHDPKVKIFRNAQNLGAGATRNVGLKETAGRFIAFLDGDDIWHQEKLEKQIAFMLSHNAPLSHTSYSFINEKGKDHIGLVKASSRVNLIDLLQKTEMGTSTVMLDTLLVGKDFAFSKLRNRQDLILWAELLARGHESYGLDQILAKYRLRKGQVSGNKLKMAYKTFWIYMKFPYIPPWQRFLCFQSYIKNAFLKRIRQLP